MKKAFEDFRAEDAKNGAGRGGISRFVAWQISRLMGAPFLLNVSIVALGPFVSQALSILLSPFITRLYGPASFGALGTFLSILSILVPISSMSYTYAIILPKRDEDGGVVLKFCIFFSLLVSVVVLILVLMLRDPFARLLNLEEFSVYLNFIPLALFFTTASIAFDEWMIRKKKFKESSGITISQSVLSNGSLIGLGYLLPQYASLIGVNFFARGFHALAAHWVIKPDLRKSNQSTRGNLRLFFGKMRSLLHEYRDFPIYRTPQILISTLSYNLPIILMTIFFGPVAAGFYSHAHRVMKLPSIIISESVGKVFLQRISQAAHEGRSLQPLIIKTTLLLVGIGILPMGLISITGPSLFAFIFGAEWYLSGVFARWIALWVLVTFSSVPVVMAIPLLKLQKQYLIFEIISLFSGGLSLVIGFVLLQDNVLAVVLFSVVGALLTAIWMVIVIILSKNRNRYQLVDDDGTPATGGQGDHNDEA